MDAADPSPRRSDTSADTLGQARVGCSGWVYADWRGLVYPDDVPQRRWFELYCGLFDTVEVNTTFYRLPEPSTVEAWAAQAPDGFVFSPKLGQYCTHRKKLKDPDQWLGNHLDRVRRFGPHLGPNLVQLPPRWRRDVGRLEQFLDALPKDVSWAVEVRDRSWLHDDVFESLRRHGVALCVHDLIPDHPWLLTADFTYVRFHGPDAIERPYQDRYGPGRLARVADRLQEWRVGGCDVWAYFNNDWDANAVHDATWLRAALAA